MAGEASAPVNVEKQVEGENFAENIHDLVKQQNDKINQIQQTRFDQKLLGQSLHSGPDYISMTPKCLE